MNFKESKAIYLQIADRICDEILLGQYPEEERIPSVREYAAIVEVNANTVMRSFDYLQVQVSVSAILYCCPFLALISLRGIKMKHYGFRK